MAYSSEAMTDDLHARYRASLPSFVKPMFAEPISIDRGEGSYVVSVEGDRYLDFFGGVLTTMIGHAHPKVVAAVQKLIDAELESIQQRVGSLDATIGDRRSR